MQRLRLLSPAGDQDADGCGPHLRLLLAPLADLHDRRPYRTADQQVSRTKTTFEVFSFTLQRRLPCQSSPIADYFLQYIVHTTEVRNYLAVSDTV